MGSGPSGISGGSGFADDPHARTHHQGWPVPKLPARNYASVRRSIRSSIWRRSHRANNRADRHALSEYGFLMRMLWIEGFTPHMPCSIPGRNRVDRHFLFDRVVITTERSDARLGFSGFRKVARRHGSKPWHESFDGLYLLEFTYTPTKSHGQTTGARGLAGPAHTTAATFLLKIFRFVVAGGVVMSGHSCIHEHRKLIFRRPADQ